MPLFSGLRAHRRGLYRCEECFQDGIKQGAGCHDATHPVQQNLCALCKVIVIVDYRMSVNFMMQVGKGPTLSESENLGLI